MQHHPRRFLLAAMIVLAVLAVTALPATAGGTAIGAHKVFVSPGHSIQKAINESPPGTIIVLEPGVYRQSVQIRKDRITLQGSGASKEGTVLQPPAKYPPNLCRQFFKGTGVCILATRFDHGNIVKTADDDMWTDCVSRSRRASRTLPSSRPHTTPRSRPGSTPSALTLSPAARAAIDGHVRLLLAWTEAINLTGIREPAAVATAHVVDSLSGVADPARARHRPVHRPGLGRRLPGPPDRRRPARRPCAPARAGGEEGRLPVGRGECDGPRRTPSRRRRSAPRHWPPIAAIAVAGRG